MSLCLIGALVKLIKYFYLYLLYYLVGLQHFNERIADFLGLLLLFISTLFWLLQKVEQEKLEKLARKVWLQHIFF
jgi:hypothetical protein